MTIRILVAEDHLIARVGLGAIVNAQRDMAVVGEAANGHQAVALYRQHKPDVTLMDMRMPGMNGYEAASQIRKEFPDARILALSTFGGDGDIHISLRTSNSARGRFEYLRTYVYTCTRVWYHRPPV